ncbi:MAG: hypothetical protein NTX49_08205 [Chlamydiae bacterium]|nr:hypothetical protein [Chlamydiota bacterium]
MSVSRASVPPLDMFTVRMQDCKDFLVQCNTELENASEILSIGRIEQIRREFTDRLADIESQFDKIASANAIHKGPARVSESFAEKQRSFAVIRKAGEIVLQKADDKMRAVSIALLSAEQTSAGFLLQSEPRATADHELLPLAASCSGSFLPPFRNRSSSLDLSYLTEVSPCGAGDAGLAGPCLGLSPLLHAAGALTDLPENLSLGEPSPVVRAGAPSAFSSVESLSPASSSGEKRRRESPLRHLPIKPAQVLNGHEIGQLMTRLLDLLKDVPETLQPLTPEQERNFGIAFGSEEYVRYTELQELGKLGRSSSQVQSIERKIANGLRCLRSDDSIPLAKPRPAKKR